ncbi:serine hydrolase domain-containing protein [Aquimarina gracilis]|uniref:Serine hydrolase domain-containing protein n=1 Tax=Aquimarina gracilis TaxID=874422 RepID=A0ABU5ZWG1_9FLAO|nr:serine hydrolase domain-containing protein [Aquimarina gracilis]MEB3346211.1 serine hydrolase domain-containing protein [Aquimarina gracilis]
MRNFIKILSIVCLLASCKQTSVKAQSGSENSNVSEKLNTYLNRLEKNGFSGSILVAQKGKILLEKGYGYANRDENVSCTPSTVFDIGSITKQFTGAAILKLEMQGKLSVQDKVSSYFSDLPKDKSDITLHQLLTHSSGLPPGIGDDYTEISTQKFVNEAFGKKLLFKPGSAYEYSNVGYSILGIIIEKVSGVSYEEYLAKNLWTPARMKQTGYKKPEFREIAVGYKNNKKWGRPTEKEWSDNGPYWHLKANGGVLSTVQDMYKWHLALLNNEILDSKAKAKYFTKHIEEGEGANSYYGYGWAIFPTPRNTELIAHNGGNGIFFADMWRYLEEDITIIIMTNAVNRKVERIASNVAGILLKPGFDPNVTKDLGNKEIEEELVDQLIEKFMASIASSDKKVWKTFIETHTASHFMNSFPMEQHLNYFKEFHDNLGGGEVVQIKLQENEVVFHVKINDEISVVNFGIAMDAKDKFKIEGIQM